MNKLALALALTAMGATASSAQVLTLNTGASISTDRLQDGTWRRQGTTDIYVRTRIDANGNRVVERARRDALGNYIVIDSRVVTAGDNRNRNDGSWNNRDNTNRVYVRRRVDANGNLILEKARRDANGNYVVFDTKVLGKAKLKDRDNNGVDDRWQTEGHRNGKWKKDKDGKKWDKEVNKAEKAHMKSNGKAKGKNK